MFIYVGHCRRKFNPDKMIQLKPTRRRLSNLFLNYFQQTETVSSITYEWRCSMVFWVNTVWTHGFGRLYIDRDMDCNQVRPCLNINKQNMIVHFTLNVIWSIHTRNWIRLKHYIRSFSSVQKHIDHYFSINVGTLVF